MRRSNDPVEAVFEGLSSGPIRTVLGLLAILAILFSCHWLKAAHDEQSIDLYEFVFSLVFMVFEWGHWGYWFFVGMVAGIAMWGGTLCVYRRRCSQNGFLRHGHERCRLLYTRGFTRRLGRFRRLIFGAGHHVLGNSANTLEIRVKRDPKDSTRHTYCHTIVLHSSAQPTIILNYEQDTVRMGFSQRQAESAKARCVICHGSACLCRPTTCDLGR